MLALDGIWCKACACVPFCHTGMTGKALGTKYLSANQAVTNVMLGAKSLNARCIRAQNADIVEHGGLVQELAVKSQFGVRITYLHTEICHLSTMGEQYLFQFGLICVIAMNECLWVHGINIFLPCFT